jgi:hypothetical protein
MGSMIEMIHECVTKNLAELPKFPCRVDEMTSRFKLQAHSPSSRMNWTAHKHSTHRKRDAEI